MKEATENGNSDGSTGSILLILEAECSEVKIREKWKTLWIQKVNDFFILLGTSKKNYFIYKRTYIRSIEIRVRNFLYSVPILYPLKKGKAPHFCEALSLLVAGTGLEPVTFGL